MNLQTVNDLIEELQRLPPTVRKQPVYLGIDTTDARDRSIAVVQNGGTVSLWQDEREVEGVPDLPDPFPLEVTCPECQHDFRVHEDGEVV